MFPNKAWAEHLGWDEDIDDLTPSRWLAWHFINQINLPHLRADHWERLAAFALTGSYTIKHELEGLRGLNELEAERWFE